MTETYKVLFYALIGFITINAFLSFFLWRYTKKNIYLRTLYFWLFNYISMGMQFFYPGTNHAEIIMVYGLVNITTILAYSIYCELSNTKGHYRRFIAIGAVATGLTLLLVRTDLSFTTKTMPYAISVSAPLACIMRGIFFSRRKSTTLLEKFLGVIIGFWIIHAFNFAFFRMDASTQTIGWMTSYALFDLLGIILPAISIEEQSSTEQERLKNLVAKKTHLLSSALEEKELLLKILVHDISNPLTVMKWYLQHASKEQAFNPKTLEKILYSQGLVEEIVKNVRLQHVNAHKNVKQISVTQCIEEMKFIFSKQLEEKNLTFVIDDQTNGEDFIFADHSSFNHNVLSNFTSNAIKFSPDHSKIIFSIKRDNGFLELAIQDFGKGMSPDMIKEIMDQKEVTSTVGTHGETGTGLGLGIARSVLESMGARFQINSSENNNGTKVVIHIPLEQVTA